MLQRPRAIPIHLNPRPLPIVSDKHGIIGKLLGTQSNQFCEQGATTTWKLVWRVHYSGHSLIHDGEPPGRFDNAPAPSFVDDECR